MTKEEREEAIEIIRKEYLCVDRDCDIERNCGKCDLMMPSKEPILKAYKMAIQALDQEPCEDAISRQAVLDMMQMRISGKELYKAVYELPLVNPTKTGHWIFVDKAHEHAHCSECDYGDVDLLDGRPHNYCPNCGAKMVELQERSDKE
ncbi:MAG: hypothetical protein IIY21_24050 [Clostridiales bacterium]|nr:hypothetical protein [Clostridiales bacterium]